MQCPHDLQPLARDLQQLDPATRRQFIESVGQLLALVMNRPPAGEPLPPLTAEQQAVIDYLTEHGVTPAEELAHHAGYSPNTVKRWCGPDGVLRKHGVTATRTGYGIAQPYPPATGKPPLTAEQKAIISHLQEHGLTSSEDLAAKIGYDAKTIKRWCGPSGDLRHYGVIATSRGYGIRCE